MILSMTGFGRGVASAGNKKITVEIKSLNGKQLDMMMRVPSYFRELEVGLRSRLAQAMERGKSDVVVTVENLVAEATSSVQVGVLASYKKQIEEAAVALGVAVPQDWFPVLMRMPDVMHNSTVEIEDSDCETLYAAADAAVEALTAFRKQEGAKLEVFFRSKIDNISRLLSEVDPFEAERVVRIRQKLNDQLTKFTGPEYDAGRLEQEMIYYIEKLDVTEEKTRLRAHISYFLETMDSPHSEGKKLGFIAQEMGREINTLGSKSNNADMQRIVVEMKDELEQIKEQVLNVL